MEVEVRKLTVLEFREIEFDDRDTNWYELIDGEVIKRKAPTPQHQEILSELTDQIKAYIKQNKLGKVFFAPIDVFLDEVNQPQPDLVFVAADQANIITRNGIEGVPRLVVEIISPSSIVRDRITKKAIYEQAGVAEYWLVDPQNSEIEIYALVDGRYELYSAASVTEGKLLSKLFAEFTVDLTTLFA